MIFRRSLLARHACNQSLCPAGVGRVAIQYRCRKDDVVTNTSYWRTDFGYGMGVIINLTENILFSIGTQSVKYDDKKVRGNVLNMSDVSLRYQW